MAGLSSMLSFADDYKRKKYGGHKTTTAVKYKPFGIAMPCGLNMLQYKICMEPFYEKFRNAVQMS